MSSYELCNSSAVFQGKEEKEEVRTRPAADTSDIWLVSVKMTSDVCRSLWQVWRYISAEEGLAEGVSE